MKYIPDEVIFLKTDGATGAMEHAKKIDALCSEVMSPLLERNNLLIGSVICDSTTSVFFYDVSTDAVKFYKLTNSVKPLHFTYDTSGR